MRPLPNRIEAHLVRAARPEPACTAIGLIELVDLNEMNDGNLLDNQLRDALTALDANRLTGIEIHRDNLDLATIMGIDEAWGVRDREAALERHATSRLNEAGIAVRKRDRDTR